jgi:flagellar motor switch protein FliN/FliY
MTDTADGTQTLDDDQEAPILDSRSDGAENRHKRAIFDLPVDVVIAVGRARPKVKDLLQMKRDSLISLDTKLDDPVEIMVGKRVIARGQLQELEDGSEGLGVRLTEIVDVSEPF